MREKALEDGMMVFNCKHQCSAYLGKKTSSKRYLDGFKRCTICCVYIKWDGKRCPCCNANLRVKAHANLVRRQRLVVRI